MRKFKCYLLSAHDDKVWLVIDLHIDKHANEEDVTSAAEALAARLGYAFVYKEEQDA